MILINESEAPFRFIMIGDRQPSEICVYRRYTDVLDYDDGERADEPVEVKCITKP